MDSLADQCTDHVKKKTTQELNQTQVEQVLRDILEELRSINRKLENLSTTNKWGSKL